MIYTPVIWDSVVLFIFLSNRTQIVGYFVGINHLHLHATRYMFSAGNGHALSFEHQGRGDTVCYLRVV